MLRFALSWMQSKRSQQTYWKAVLNTEFEARIMKSQYPSGGPKSPQFSSVQSLSHVRLFVTPWIATCQASLSITNSQSSLRLPSIESVMPSRHLILCRPLVVLPPIPPSIRVFSNESTLRMRWPKYWSFSFTIITHWEKPWCWERLKAKG